MANTTPGLWLSYFAGPLLSIPGSVTIALIPGGSVVYFHYLFISTYNDVPQDLGIYLAIDGTPIMMINHGNTAIHQYFKRPIPCANSLTMGGLGTLGGPKNMVVAYMGEAV